MIYSDTFQWFFQNLSRGWTSQRLNITQMIRRSDYELLNMRSWFSTEKQTPFSQLFYERGSLTHVGDSCSCTGGERSFAKNRKDIRNKWEHGHQIKKN